MNKATNLAFSGNEPAGRKENDDKSISVDQRMRRAVERIEASRSALIVCMAPEPPPQRSAPAARAASGNNGIEPPFVEALMARIKRNGLIEGSWRTVRTLARRWWTRQPWHGSFELVGQTVAYQARPLMRRHPLATLAVGAVVGAALVAVVPAIRPWAVHQIRGKASPWGDRVRGLLWTQLTSAPVQMALAGALAAWVADQGTRNPRSGSKPEKGPARPDDAGDPQSVVKTSATTAGGPSG
jgi:hypothetical protein